ncbi:Sulfotransferase [Apodemus speciosus]|uniref:Sulfotransferase n=1 Tax=Apodemus speciosus TaxID=105296 RepID=A0ABQ0EWZ6_APOSI
MERKPSKENDLLFARVTSDLQSSPGALGLPSQQCLMASQVPSQSQDSPNDPVTQKKKRNVLSKEQKLVLGKHFANSKYVSQEQYKTLVKQLGMKENQIKLLSYCWFTFFACGHLYEVLSNTHLSLLDLGSNFLEDTLVNLLCEALKDPKYTLKELWLDQCEFRSDCCEDLSLALTTCKTLKSLNVDWKPLDHSMLVVLCEALNHKDCNLNTLASGTNWLTEIVCLIQTKGDPKWIQSVPIWERSPCVESEIGHHKLINKEGPRLMISHLPIYFFHKSLFSSKTKVNPRDVLVSGYFFWGKTNLIKNPGSMETYFEWFLKGNVPYGSWFEHIRGWLSMREEKNFLLLCYDDLKRDIRGTIEKICEFLGKKIKPDEMDLIIKYSSFQAMKENKMCDYNIIAKDVVTNGLQIFRKGTTGDWKNYFTVAQAEAFDKVYQEKMAGFPPGLFPWE